jgi:hypothetical protein
MLFPWQGSKLFWRQRLTVEFHFIHHTKRNCLEILAYISEKDAELQHVYVDFKSLMSQIEPMLQGRMEQTRAELKKDRFKRIPSDEELRTSETKKLVEEYLLSKLMLDQDDVTKALQVSLQQHTSTYVSDELHNSMYLVLIHSHLCAWQIRAKRCR